MVNPRGLALSKTKRTIKMNTDTKSHWITAGKHTLLQRVSMLLFGALTFYLLVRILTKEEYGVWMLFVSMSTLIQMTREGFLKKPLIRFLNIVPDEERSILQSTSLTLNVFFSVVTGGFLVLISGFLAQSWEAPDLIMLFQVYFGTNLIYGVFNHYNNVQEAHSRFGGPFMGNMLKSALLFACVLFFSLTGHPLSLFTLVICDFVTAIVSTGVIMMYSRELVSFKITFRRKWAVELLSYGRYTMGTNISAIILRNTDAWMLGWFISPAAVAVYNVAIRIANLFEVPTMAMAQVLFPQAVKKTELEGDKAVKALYEKSVTVLLIMILPITIGVILFSEEIVRLLAGENYAEAGVILKITMLYGLIIPLSKQMGILMEAIGRARLNMLFVTRGAIINGVLNCVFIPYFGIIGAAYATLIAVVINQVLNQLYLIKNFNVDLKNLGYYTGYYFRIVRSNIRGTFPRKVS